MKKKADAPLVRIQLTFRGELKDESALFRALSDYVIQDSAHIPPSHEGSVDLLDLACRMYQSRILRSKIMPSSLFGEPAWDLLLALYCLGERGEMLSISGLGYAAHVPATTALRWSQTLESRKLIERTKDLFDGRRYYVKLTSDGRALMDEYLISIKNKLISE